MFALCDAMRWNHLPVAGGLYDQHPKLIDDFMTIFAMRGEYEAEKAAEEKRNMEQRTRKRGRR